MEDIPEIFHGGLKAAAQWQIAARYLHSIQNEEYIVKMSRNKYCGRCKRKFLKIFNFIRQADEEEFPLCHACIASVGAEGVWDFLSKNDKDASQD